MGEGVVGVKEGREEAGRGEREGASEGERAKEEGIGGRHGG